MVVVDSLSKYNHFVLFKDYYTTKSFMKEVLSLHGIPNSIITDRDPLFVSKFWKETFRLQGTRLKLIYAYHLEIDGKMEILNRCLENYLRCFASEQPVIGLIGYVGKNFGIIPLSIYQQGKQNLN